MKKKEVSEIRKTLKPSKCCIDKLYGFMMDPGGNVQAELPVNFLTLTEDVTEKYCALIGTVLSGKIGKSLYQVEFPLDEETDEDGKQPLLYRIATGMGKNISEGRPIHADIRTLADRIGEVGDFEDPYALFIAHCMYDIPHKAKDGATLEDGASVYEYIVAGIYPVKQIKSTLVYNDEKGAFVNQAGGAELKAPECGFVYPNYVDHTPDIHSAMYYAKKEENRHDEIVEVIFGKGLSTCETEQKYLFTNIVEKSLGRDCTFERVTAAADELQNFCDETGEEETVIGKEQIRRILQESGADEEAVARLDSVYDEVMEEGNEMRAENLSSGDSLEIKAEGLKIAARGSAADLLETRMVDGRECIVIPVANDMTLNGIALKAKSE